jgi:hydrogenase maturation protein HypF
MPIVATGTGACWQIDWRPALAAILSAREKTAPPELAARFHVSLAQAIADVAKRTGLPAVALSGGCFQNVLLLDLTSEALRSAGLQVLRHHDLPANDGALAAGQALGVLWGITEVL